MNDAGDTAVSIKQENTVKELVRIRFKLQSTTLGFVSTFPDGLVDVFGYLSKDY